ncbi:MAG: YigZ family protein [Clostridia bacterium]|nr:YigZ family protein [Clostridia bacterium]
MNKKVTYRTVKYQGEAELIEKKSRFIGHARPVKTEEEALLFISDMRAKFYDATHNVYAYILQENNIARFSDDGEPGGTAGMPTLEVLKKENVTDCVVVVTRYFGGTLLGAGGLVRAYSKAAKMGLDDAEIVEKTYCYGVEMTAGYELLGKLRYIVENGGHILDDILYNEDITIKAYIKYDSLERFKKEVTEASLGKTEVKITGEMYV